MHSGYDPADVQDPSVERLGVGLQSIGSLLGWYQVQRCTGNIAGHSAGCVFLIHITFQASENTVEAKTSAQHLQLVHDIDGAASVCCSLLLSHLFGSRSCYSLAKVIILYVLEILFLNCEFLRIHSCFLCHLEMINCQLFLHRTPSRRKMLTRTTRMNHSKQISLIALSTSYPWLFRSQHLPLTTG